MRIAPWFIASMCIAAACGGGHTGGEADAALDASVDSPPIDGAGGAFSVITHSRRFGLARARLVSYRVDGGPWLLATETIPGEYTGPVQGTLLDVLIVCMDEQYDDVYVQLVHLTKDDPLTLRLPFSGSTPSVPVAGQVRPAGSQVAMPHSFMPSADTFDTEVRQGVGDVVAMSSTGALIMHDIPFSGPTQLDLDIDVNGSPFEPLDITVSGAAPSETVVLRSSVITRNGTSPISRRDVLFPRAQLASGDVRRASATVTDGSFSRSVTVFSNQVGAMSASLPAWPGGADFQRAVDSLGAFTWQDAFDGARSVGMTLRTSDGIASRGFSAHVSARRLQADGVPSDGEYRFPDLSTVPGWETRWNPLPGAATWDVQVVGGATEFAFGAEPRDGDVRWSTFVTGTTGSAARGPSPFDAGDDIVRSAL